METLTIQVGPCISTLGSGLRPGTPIPTVSEHSFTALVTCQSQQTNHKRHQAIERTKEFDPETYHTLQQIWRRDKEALVAARRCSLAGQPLLGHQTKPN